MLRPAALAVALVLLLPALARAGCGPLPDRSAERASLLAALGVAATPEAAQAATARLWRFWFTAPDPVAQDLLDRGGRELRARAWRSAEALFSDLIAHCPAYAEGWNQRAFARYLAGDLAGSLADIAEALAREPAHFGALSGRAGILQALGRMAEAEAAMQAAERVNPWIRGRPPGEPI